MFSSCQRRQPILSDKEEKTEKEIVLTCNTNSASVRIHKSIVFNTVFNIFFYVHIWAINLVYFGLIFLTLHKSEEESHSLAMFLFGVSSFDLSAFGRITFYAVDANALREWYLITAPSRSTFFDFGVLMSCYDILMGKLRIFDLVLEISPQEFSVVCFSVQLGTE